MSAPIVVTSDTRRSALAGLPAAVRFAFRLAAEIRCGSLDVTLPDGRMLRFRGAEAAPPPP